MPLVRSLFEAHPDQKHDPVLPKSWLHFAAHHGRLEIVKLLLELEININEHEKYDGRTPLNSACSFGHLDVAKYLLDHGAVMDVSASIRNPLFGAIVGRSPQIARLLMDRGIDTTVRYNSLTMKDMDAIAFAWMQGEREIARMIAEKHANGDEAKIEALLAEADAIADANTVPVKPGEEDRVSDL